jgi:hypothetical protein
VLDNTAASRLRLNPRLKILKPLDRKDHLTLCSPVRGAELKRLELSRERDPTLFEVVVGALIKLNRGASAADLAPEVPTMLSEWGILISDGAASAEVAFRCELPSGSDAGAGLGHALLESPVLDWVRVLPSGEGPDGLEVPLSSLSPHSQLVWVRYRPSGAWLPYWASDSRLTSLLRAQKEAGSVSRLDRELLTALVQAGDWQRQPLAVMASDPAYASSRYVTLPQLVSRPWLAAARKFYADAISEGYFGLDRSAVNQFFNYQEPLARLLQRQLTPLVAALWGRPVQPSYTYSVSYRPHAVLEVHTDREQCEHTISLLLEHTPSVEGPSPWPLCVIAPETRTTMRFHQSPGDGLLFRGRELPHFREELPAGHTSTSMFLHYVSTDFEGSLA